MKYLQAQYSLEDDGDKVFITLDQYQDGVHIAIQNKKETILLSAKQSDELRDILYKGLRGFDTQEEVVHTHTKFGGMLDCKGCNN